MIETQRSSSNVTFWDGLDRWYRVIQHFVKRGRAPRGMTEESYAKLHRELRSHFDSLSANEKTRLDQVHQLLYRSLRPWVHLDSLAHCDKRILRMLEQEIRVIREKLMPRRRWRSQVLNRVAAVAIVLSLAAIMLGFLGSNDARAVEVVNHLQSGWDFLDGVRAQMWLAMAQSSTNQRLIALAGSMLVIGVFFLRDRRRF